MSGFHEKFILLDSFSKNILVPNFMKIRPVLSEAFHTDRRIDMTKLVIASFMRTRLRTEGAETENKAERGKRH